MKKTELLKNQFTHMHWADAELWKAIKSSENIKNNKKIKKLLYHLHLVQFLFYKIWNSESLEYPKEDDFADMDEVIDWAKGNYFMIENYLSASDESVFDQKCKIPWSKGFEDKFGRKPDEVTIFDTMLQVVSHSTHHRAQLNMLLSELEVVAPIVDYIFWLWMGKPDDVI